jgi:hypothetical protein
MKNEAKKLEKEIHEWRRIGVKQGNWLFIATVGCCSIPVEVCSLRWAAMILIIMIFLHELNNAVAKFTRIHTFKESLLKLKNEITQEEYECIAKKLTYRESVKQTYTMLFALLFYIISFFYLSFWNIF